MIPDCHNYELRHVRLDVLNRLRALVQIVVRNHLAGLDGERVRRRLFLTSYGNVYHAVRTRQQRGVFFCRIGRLAVSNASTPLPLAIGTRWAFPAVLAPCCQSAAFAYPLPPDSGGVSSHDKGKQQRLPALA